MSKLCHRNQQSFLSSIPIPIDGAVVISRNERDVDCVITFQTESILERFMIRFEELAIDCNDKLYIYDGAHAIGSHKVMRSLLRSHFSSKTLLTFDRNSRFETILRCCQNIGELNYCTLARNCLVFDINSEMG